MKRKRIVLKRETVLHMAELASISGGWVTAPWTPIKGVQPDAVPTMRGWPGC